MFYLFRYRKKGVANSSGIQNLQYVGQLIDWNAKTCPKKSVGKSLTRSANKYQGKSVNKPRNQNVNKFVSLYIGARFVNCDWTTINFLYKKKYVPFLCFRILYTLTKYISILQGDQKHQKICHLINISAICSWTSQTYV